MLREPAVMTVANDKSTTEEVLEFYEAYNELSKILNSSSNVVSLQLKPGQTATTHNARVLHGRTGFDPTSAGDGKVSRWMQTIFFEWDIVFSKLRVLQKRLGLKTPRLYKESNDFF